MSDGQTYFSLDLDADGSARIVRANGEIDAAVAPMLEEHLDRAGPGHVVFLDLSGVSFIDSSALRAITVAHRRAEDAGGSLQVRGASEPVARVFEITGLTALFAD